MVCGWQEFIEDFFDQNPLSQLGIIATRKSLAEKISEMSGNKTAHFEVGWDEGGMRADPSAAVISVRCGDALLRP